ncbi:MAG: hypothetical protein QOK40_1657 [Miltoncostaeaceae bacterium]|nr:hypothetical protein [Miltoncostaeaceae bacterium]
MTVTVARVGPALRERRRALRRQRCAGPPPRDRAGGTRLESVHATASARFVGRARELATLEALLRVPRLGPTPLVLLHGEAGIGKTSTAAEFARRARRSGSLVLWGTCWEGGGAAPYGPWLEALSTAVDGHAPERMAALLGPDSAVLGELLPAVRRALPDLPSAPALAPGQTRLRLYEAVVRLLDGLDGSPVLILDDLQWADPAALELFVYVARLARRPLIVATYRGTGLDLDHPLAQRLAEANRHRPCEHLLLPTLSREEAAALLESAAGRELEPELVDVVWSESGGNPFFLAELGRHVHLDDHAACEGPARRQLPETVRQAVALRLAALSAQTRQVLALAAACTAGFGLAELRALTELDEPVLIDALEEALAAELIRSLGGERYDFAHALVRHALYERFSPSRRARLHRRLAEALERAEDPAQVASELARQYRASLSVPGAERGVAHALRAAEQARAAHAPADALELLGIALELTPAGDLANRGRITAALALAEAEACRLDDAPRTLEAALSLLEQTGADAETLAGLVYQVVSALADAWASQDGLAPLIANGLALLGEDRGLAWARLKLLERRYDTVPAGPHFATRWEGLDPEAVRIARTHGSEADYARTLDWHDSRSLSGLDELIPRIEAWRDPAARLRGLEAIVAFVVLKHCGSPAAERLCARLEQLAEELGSLPAQALASAYRAALLSGRGELDAAVATASRATALAERFDPAGRVHTLASFIGDLTAMHLTPDWERLAARMLDLATSRHRVPAYGLRHAAVASLAFAKAGQDREARDLLVHVIPALVGGDPHDHAQNAAVCIAGAAIWQLQAADLAGELLPAALALIDAGQGDFFMTSNELTVALLATLLGRVGDALEFFARARATFDELGLRPQRAGVDHHEAAARRRLRQPGAERLSSSAQAQYAALGIVEWRLRETRSADLPDGLTRREAELLRMVAAGRTNKEIAAELVLSVHTVERHLLNAYRKASVRNRADATAYVLRLEL